MWFARSHRKVVIYLKLLNYPLICSSWNQTNATGHLNARRISAGWFSPIMSMLVCLCRFSFFIFTVGLSFGVKMPMGSVFYFLHLFTARNRVFHVYAHIFGSLLSAYFSVFSPNLSSSNHIIYIQYKNLYEVFNKD